MSEYKRGRIVTSLFFILLILLLPTQLGKHWWPSWSLVEGIRVDYLSPTLYLTDGLLLGLGGYLLSRSSFTRPKYSRRVLIFFIFLIPLVWRTDRPWLALYWLLRYLQIPLTALVTAKALNVQSSKFNVRSLLAVGVVFSVGLELVQVVLGGTTGWFWILGERSFNLATPGIATVSVLGREVLRPYATFPHPNALAGWLAVAGLLIGGIRGLRGVDKISKVAFLGVFLTASRGAIIGLLVASAWCLVGRQVMAGEAIFTLVHFSEAAVEERVYLMKASGRMFLDQPLLGVGPGQFLVKLPKYLSGPSFILQPVHSVPWLVLAEFGLIGAAIGLIGLIRLIRHVSSQGSIQQLFPLLLVFLITSLVDHYWVTAQQNRLLLGLTLGLILANSKFQASNPKQIRGTKSKREAVTYWD